MSSPNRRDFLQKGIIIGAAGITGLGLINGCKGKEEEEEGQKVTPSEDLMQEHGLLNRILLIYDNCKAHLADGASFPMEAIQKSASIIRTFVEDYHEKQEEQYLFPRFQKANQLVDLVQVLLIQHNAGRRLTDQIMQLSKTQKPTEFEHQSLINALTSFNNMYRPHEAREDTILFPAFRKLVSPHEYDSLGEEFEKNEEKHFGKDGFEHVLANVADIEKSLGIYDLSNFTPKD